MFIKRILWPALLIRAAGRAALDLGGEQEAADDRSQRYFHEAD